MALLAKSAPDAVTAIEAAAKSTAMPEAKSGQPDAAALAANPTVKVARGYLAACAKADAPALDALFLDKGRATVSENAGDEGTWETYRDHHLLPELKEMPGFAMTVTKEDVQTFGTSSVPEERIAAYVLKHFDMRPKAIIEQLDLLRPVYRPTSAYGHFGRSEPGFTWERTDRAHELREALG
jgi:hypothetical protein